MVTGHQSPVSYTDAVGPSDAQAEVSEDAGIGVMRAVSTYGAIRDALTDLYLTDPRPWLVGFSGGKDSTMLAALIFDAVLAVPAAARSKPISVLCTDTRVEIPAISDLIEGTLGRMRRFSDENGLGIEVVLLKPPPEQSFWVNVLGRGYPPPNRVFRWCTQRLADTREPLNHLRPLWLCSSRQG